MASLVRLFREMCGTYYPGETSLDKRFVLDSNGIDVPVFVNAEHKTQIPQIQITPFIGDKEYFVELKTERAPGEEPYTNPDLDYVISEENVHLKEAKFQIDILAENSTSVRSIKDSLVSRLRKFENLHIGTFQDSENWTVDLNIYKTTHYNSNYLRLLRIYDGDKLLTKTESADSVYTTLGSWFIGLSGLFINPETTLENLTFIEIIYGEAFRDGYTMKEKGIRSLRASHSAKVYEKSPELSRWTMTINIKYSEIEEKDIGRSFKEAGVDAQTD